MVKPRVESSEPGVGGSLFGAAERARNSWGVIRRAGVLLLALLPVLPAADSLAQRRRKPPAKDQPTILVALPFGVKPGAATRLTLRGLKLEGVKEVRVSPKGTVKLLKKRKSGPPNQMEAKIAGDSEAEIELTVPADAPGEAVQVVVVGPAGASAPHPVRIDRAPVVPEKEPNDGFKQAQRVAVGQVIQGTISRSQDVDLFRFEGKAGQKVVLEVHARRLGSALDSVLTLYDGGGAILETCDDIDGGSDSRIEATLPKDGTYYAGVTDANDQGAAFFLYRLTIRAK